MFKSAFAAPAAWARGAVLLSAALLIATGSASAAQKEIRWGTGPVGSSGGKALVVLAQLLNQKMPEFHIDVLPTPGAVTTVKGFATGQYDGYYGSDVAMKELKSDSGRFKGFKAQVKEQPVQSFWAYTLDVGLAINEKDKDTIKSWADLTGKPVYTGPLPFDTRKHLENAMHDVGVNHVYRQVDLSTAGSQLASGSIKAMIVYVAGGKTPAPWISEASLAVNWIPLNPTPEETAKLKKDGFEVSQIPMSNFHKSDTSGKMATLLPFYWGFDVGKAYSTDEMAKMLDIIDKNADELAKQDPSFRQLAGGKMAEFEYNALKATWNLVPIHPGLAKWLKQKGKWDPQWDSNVAHLSGA